ncbi:MAG: DNA-binding response regulator [Flavobacterium sp. BFFFF1]|uniref:response regulator transcription factor n=1 Tax=unclassified Flavobacterium TaxID=196869 RepID=UPI000BC468B3|nr:MULTISPECIES: response regulator transcription factor [unclassified Flavobacterium]OYU82269.1 MAG: DNA-binding response regulator [Flavobacterium sp. BFFFF1]
MNILIVEDHQELADELTDYLRGVGYLCKQVSGCADALEETAVNSYDVMLLDLGLPDGNGMDVLRDIRKTASKMVVIILTARGELDDRISGLQLGADDYLTKPFALTELGARLHAIVRRMHGYTANEIVVHGFTIRLDDFKVCYGDVQLNLTKKEFQIFRYLILNKNRVITRLQLTEHIWGDVLEINSDSNFIDVHVRNLRHKLDKHTEIDWFETVRNVGYRINQ